MPRTKLSEYLIAIVEDDQHVRGGLQDLILSLGYRVAAFASALDYLKSGSVRDTACLVSDIQMADMNGIELQERLIADGHRIPIIFATAIYSEAARNRALNAGALDLLQKPYDESRLIECLDRALKDSG
jgi:FixJ family two-component response regulator